MTDSPTALAPAPPRLWPVILSGGSGTRLWPLSRSHMPKQLLALGGSAPMIVTTAARTTDGAHFHPPIVVTGAAHAAMIREQLGPAARLIVEPAARNTAPAIALAVLSVLADDPQGVLLVMPSDHQVAAPEKLRAAIARATPAAQAGWLVTFGIHAATPETGYGYINAGDPIGDGVHAVRRFVEKPDLARAREFVANGGYSWNSGIFLFSAAAMHDALAAHAPGVLAAAHAAYAAAAIGDGRIDPDAAAFAQAPSISIDHGVFEHAARVAVCPVDPGWSDIGSWDALAELGPADADGNVATGRVETVDSHGCLLRAEGVLLAAIGVDDLNIIATPDAVLVTARGRSQEVRSIAARLAGDRLLAQPAIEARAWGEERIVHDGAGLAVRRVVLDGTTGRPTAAASQVMLIDGSARCGAATLAPGVATPGGDIVTGSAGTVLLVIG